MWCLCCTSAGDGLTFSQACPGTGPFPQAAELKTAVFITECSTQWRDIASHKKRNGTQNPNVLTPLIIPFIILWGTNRRKWEHLWKITCVLFFSLLWLLHVGSGHGSRLGHGEHWDLLSKCELMTMDARQTCHNFSCRTYDLSFNPRLAFPVSGPRISNGQPSCLWQGVPSLKHDKFLLWSWQLGSSCRQYLCPGA